ncbi:MAG: glycosyl hydrolase family 17 protein [Phycisphaerales bacterium]
MGICYSPFRAGQHPDLGDGAVYPSEDEILEDLQILERDTPFRVLRLYDSGRNSEAILRLIESHDLPFKVLLGAWLTAEISNPDCPWRPEPYSDEVLHANERFNAEEVGRAIRLAHRYSETVLAVSVGNEALVGWSDHRVPLDAVTQYVRTVRAAVDQPVTVADTFDWWQASGSALAREVDFVSVHIYPLWFGRDLEEALSFTISSFESVREALPDTTIVITETGWATTGSEFGDRASEEKQDRFLRDLYDWARADGVLSFFFEAFDESWKGDPDNPEGAEKHWGLYFEDRSPKLVIRRLVDETAPESDRIESGAMASPDHRAVAASLWVKFLGNRLGIRHLATKWREVVEKLTRATGRERYALPSSENFEKAAIGCGVTGGGSGRASLAQRRRAVKSGSSFQRATAC